MLYYSATCKGYSFLVIYPRMIISYTASSIPPSSRSSLGYTTHFQVGLIVHDTSNAFMITSFSCKDFYSKYHLFKSTFLRRLASISTKQGLFISWGFGPKHHSKYKNKKEVTGQYVYSRHNHFKKKRQNICNKAITTFINIKRYYSVQ